MTDATCLTCRYLQRADPDDYDYVGDRVCGECHRFPPAMVGASDDSAVPYWPAVGIFQWCGEYRPEEC